MTPELDKQMELIKSPSIIVAKFSGDRLKRISFNRFEGHAIRWHDPYRARDKDGNPFDLAGEWFSQKTNRMLKMGYPIVGAPVNYQHGMHKDFGATGIGLLDFTEEDEIGQFVRGELFTREQYIEMLKDLGRIKGYQVSDSQYAKRADMALKAVQTLVNEVPLQFSGGFDPSTWVVDEETKHIDQSGLIHAAFTPTPADDLNPIITFKSMFTEAFNLEHERKTFDMSPSSPPATQDTAIDAQHKEPTTENAVSSKSNSITPNKGTSKMTIQELVAGMQALLAEFGESGGVPPEEAMAMAGEAVEELKAEAEALPEEEKAKAVDEELVKAWTGKAIAKLEAIRAKKVNLLNVAKNAMNEHKHNAPANMDNALGGFSAGNRSNGRIHVGDNLKYAHLGADDMALGLTTMMAQARTSGVPVTLKTFVDGGAISEEFLQTFRGKVNEMAKSEPYGKTSDGIKRNSVLKSFAQKANEIDGTLNTGFGAEWVGDFWSTTLWAKERFPLVYDRLVQKGMWTEELGQGVDTGYFPIEGADPTAYRAPQAIDLDATNRPAVTAKITPFATGYVSVTPGEIKIATSYTRIFDEDSLIRLAPQVNRQLTDKALETRDQLLINGDTETAANTNINKIDGTPTSTGLTQDYYLTSNGFRKMALVTAPAASVTSAVSAAGTLTDAQYLTTRKLFSAELRPYLTANGLFIVDPDTYESSLAFASLKTDDVNKSGATVREGELVKMWGVDVFNSGFLPEGNTAGKQSTTGSNNVHGSILGIFAKHWGVAYKRQIIIDTDFDVLSGSYVYVLSMRIGVVARGTKASVISYYVGN